MTTNFTPHHEDIAQAILASQAWVAAFNRKDVKACVAGYTEDAVMHAQPFGRFEGRAAIEAFWGPFLDRGATDLVYRDVRIHAVSKGQVILSASWSMNVGYGVITREQFVKGADDAWRLAEDHFEVYREF